MKKIVRLTESDLHRMIQETVRKVIREGNNDRFETFYRGYNSKYGSQKDHMLWITDDIGYARTYGNRVEEIVIDLDKLNLASMYDIDEILGYEVDYYNGLDEQEAAQLREEGYNGYGFEANHYTSYCICLFDITPIASRRELSREEFEDIEEYEGFDNHGYDDEYDR